MLSAASSLAPGSAALPGPIPPMHASRVATARTAVHPSPPTTCPMRFSTVACLESSLLDDSRPSPVPLPAAPPPRCAAGEPAGAGHNSTSATHVMAPHQPMLVDTAVNTCDAATTAPAAPSSGSSTGSSSPPSPPAGTPLPPPAAAQHQLGDNTAPAATAPHSSSSSNSSGVHVMDSAFLSDSLPPGRRLYLVVLNYVLPTGLPHVWSLASFRVCADGGCNRLYDQIPSLVVQPPHPDQAGGVGPTHHHHHQTAGAAGSSNGSSPRAAHASRGCDAGSPPTPAAATACDTTTTAAAAARVAVGSSGDITDGRRPSLEASAAQLRTAHLPDLVLGDLDSLRPEVREYYVQQGVPVRDLSYDQETTDLTKAVMMIEERFIKGDHCPDQHDIVAIGALGGRLDHTLSNLNTLYMFPHLRITLWGDGNLVRLLPPGTTRICPDERYEGPTCALIPLAGPATASSTGLRWNLDNLEMKVGGLISTSNLLAEPEVVVTTDTAVLWSTELHHEPQLPAAQLREALLGGRS